jgi:hypothetical protein
MAVALELAQGSRLSEWRWELVDDGRVAGTLEQTARWRRRWRAAAGAAAWDLEPLGWFGGGMVARDAGGDEVARWLPANGMLERRGGAALTVRREGLLRGERVLFADDQELVRLRPRGWRRGIDVESAAATALDEGLTLAVLMVCARLVAERQDATAAGTAAAVGVGAAGT